MKRQIDLRSLLAAAVAFAAVVAAVPATPAQSPVWVDVAPACNMIAPAVTGHGPMVGRGAAVADFNGDGLTDVVVPGEVGSTYRAFLNIGGWYFIDVSPVASLGTSTLAKMCAPADYDNDGDLDIFVCVRNGPSRLLQNNGMMMFTDVGPVAGVAMVDEAFHATWGDYDNDGFLDLYVGVRSMAEVLGSNRLFHNNGDGTFTDVTAAAGVAHNCLTFAAMWFDYDSDGLIDLFVTSDVAFVDTRPANSLYKNNGDGTFTDVAVATGFDQKMQAMGFDVADVENDGVPVFFASNTSVSMGLTNGSPAIDDGHVMWRWNAGTSAFDRVENLYGTRLDDIGWATFFCDFDLDGRQDLFVQHMMSPSALLKNTVAKPWSQIGPTSGFTTALPECAAGYADFDNDGRFDLLQPFSTAPLCLMKNPYATNGKNWLKVKLVGTTSNRDGFGARIRAVTQPDGVARTSWMRSGNGFLVGNEPVVQFGLDTNTTVATLEIFWPSGATQTLTNVASNQRLVVVEPSLFASAPELSGSRTWQLLCPADATLPYVTAVALSTTGGVVIGDRTVPLAQDPLFEISLQPGNPFVTGGIGVLSPSGFATGSFWAPPLPELSGLVIYAASVTVDFLPTLHLKSVVGPYAMTL
jgi:hypothetical protein